MKEFNKNCDFKSDIETYIDDDSSDKGNTDISDTEIDTPMSCLSGDMDNNCEQITENNLHNSKTPLLPSYMAPTETDESGNESDVEEAELEVFTIPKKISNMSPSQKMNQSQMLTYNRRILRIEPIGILHLTLDNLAYPDGDQINIEE